MTGTGTKEQGMRLSGPAGVLAARQPGPWRAG
jgi:hypothetical protein